MRLLGNDCKMHEKSVLKLASWGKSGHRCVQLPAFNGNLIKGKVLVKN